MQRDSFWRIQGHIYLVVRILLILVIWQWESSLGMALMRQFIWDGNGTSQPSEPDHLALLRQVRACFGWKLHTLDGVTTPSRRTPLICHFIYMPLCLLNAFFAELWVPLTPPPPLHSVAQQQLIIFSASRCCLHCYEDVRQKNEYTRPHCYKDVHHLVLLFLSLFLRFQKLYSRYDPIMSLIFLQ